MFSMQDIKHPIRGRWGQQVTLTLVCLADGLRPYVGF